MQLIIMGVFFGIAMLATDVFFDVTCTAFCIVFTELALLQQAHVLGMLDRETLQKPSQS